MPKACPYAMALSFDIASYPGIILYPCLGVLGGIVVVFWVVWGLFGVVLVILLVKNFAISGKVTTFVTANEGYASWLTC